MFDAQKQTLINGIKLVTIKKDTQTAAIHAGIKIGPLFENENERGISHYIEHMLFKGTKLNNNEELNLFLETLGGDYNAYTDNNCTVFSITTLSQELENSIKLLSDMLQNSIFDENELEKEREVILSEIRTGKDDIEDCSFRKVNEIGFNNSPLKYGIIGSEESVKSFTRQQLVNFYDKYYVPNNCYLSIVSPYEHQFVQDIVNKYFKDWIWKEFNRRKVVTETNIPLKKITKRKNIEQSTIIYLFTFHGLSSDEELALKIFNHKFGVSANSILFRELREKRGLAYDVYTDVDMTEEVKTLYIYTAVSSENIEKAQEIINECINNILNETIIFDENTINLMKKVLKTAVAFTLEDSTDIGNYVLHQILDDEDIFQFMTDMKRLEDIKKDELYSCARKVLKTPTIHIFAGN
jgi:predicted Zn-dependent peptidase